MRDQVRQHKERYKRRKDRRIYRVVDRDADFVTLVGRNGGHLLVVAGVDLERGYEPVVLCDECGAHHPEARRHPARQFSARWRPAPY